MWNGTRRHWLQTGLAAGAAAIGGVNVPLNGQAPIRLPNPGIRPIRDGRVTVLNPRERVPLSFIIDDSTCLVNLNRFAIPQFAAIWNHQRYQQAWRDMPLEIPDDFVRKFGNWCGEHSVKGKYSVVPFPACVGRVDRVLPGWSQKDLQASLKLVREFMVPNWDIHPEMITHTLAIDLKTGHPYPTFDRRHAENWNFTDGKSVDELTEYLAYALRILRKAGLPCEGVTTPGGFAGNVRAELAEASKQAVSDVFSAEIPHYFKYVIAAGEESVEPRVELAERRRDGRYECVVSLVACTGDWTGGWDCSNRGDVDKFITADLKRGRMVEVIERGEPALMLCHWTGIYFNGEEVGFQVFQEAVRRMHQRFDHLVWMKLSEIARYWAAKELTFFRLNDFALQIKAPYSTPDFTIRFPVPARHPVVLVSGDKRQELKEVPSAAALRSGCWRKAGDQCIACFDLPRGTSRLEWREA